MIDRILAHRNRFPAFLNRAIDYVADHPAGFLGRLAARRMGVPDVRDATKALVADPAHELRVLIGPVNYSGQARLWAKAIESADPRVNAVNLAVDVPGGFSFTADLIVPVPVYHNGERWQRAQLAAAEGFSHVLVEAEEPLFGRLFDRDVSREARHLIGHGVNVAFMCHGTDIRLPTRHRESTPWSPYLDPTHYTARLERLARDHRVMLDGLGRPVFVSTPDLLADVPSAVWCPVVVDPVVWQSSGDPSEERRPLRVVYSPTSALMKGTHLIEPLLQSLHRRGVIDYRPISGVPSAQMPDVFRSADVVLDQFRLGSYGVGACEAMAAGRLVIGHVLDNVRAEVEATTGRTLPIIEATPGTLESVLVDVSENRDALHAVRQDGMEFVSAVHDGRMSARILLDNWIDPKAPPASSASKGITTN